jgi:hypothetical protein
MYVEEYVSFTPVGGADDDRRDCGVHSSSFGDEDAKL